MYACVKLNEKDTVATATKTLEKGNAVVYKFQGEETSLKMLSNVPLYHKVAISDIKKGDPVFKYGQKIGYALADIKTGEHVHTQNLDSTVE